MRSKMVFFIAAFAGAVVIVILAVLIIVLVMKKKRSEKELVNGAGGSGGVGNPSPMNMGTQQETMDFNLSVQGVSGQFAGKTYTQGRDGRIIFGRQPSCQVFFGESDENVSGNHCVLFKQDGAAMLMDLGSTNGTYLEDGTRLEENAAYALHAGERFYLVNKDYMFMIK